MSEMGVFAVDRGIFTDPDFADEPLTEREAFLWLVSEASWKDCTRRGPKGPVTLRRGEVCHSVRFMAVAWQWSKSRVDRFLGRMVERGTLAGEKRDGEQIYSVCNYNRFQRVGLPERDSSGTVAGRERDSSGTDEKQGNITSSEPIGSSEDTPSPENPGCSPKPEIRPEANEPDEPRLAFEAYNAAARAAGWPLAKTLSDPRRSALKRRITDAGGLDGWTSALGRARASPFLTGANDRGWRADLDFFLQARSFTKLIEGGYDQRNPVPKPDRFQTRQRITDGEANLLAAFTGCDRGGPEAGGSREPYPDFAAGFDGGRTLDLVAAHR